MTNENLTWSALERDFTLRAIEARRAIDVPGRRELAEVLEICAVMAEKLAVIEKAVKR